MVVRDDVAEPRSWARGVRRRPHGQDRPSLATQRPLVVVGDVGEAESSQPPTLAFRALLSATTTSSRGSAMLSPRRVMGTVVWVWPGWKVAVPVAAA